MTDYTGWPKQK